MIIINKGEINDIFVSVSDVLPREDGEYILSMENTVSNVVTNISMSRVNTDTIRYDKFTINEASHSLDEGLYDYEIKDTSGSVGDRGKLRVIGAEVTSSVYQKADNTITYYKKS